MLGSGVTWKSWEKLADCMLAKAMVTAGWICSCVSLSCFSSNRDLNSRLLKPPMFKLTVVARWTVICGSPRLVKCWGCGAGVGLGLPLPRPYFLSIKMSALYEFDVEMVYLQLRGPHRLSSGTMPSTALVVPDDGPIIPLVFCFPYDRLDDLPDSSCLPAIPSPRLFKNWVA